MIVFETKTEKNVLSENYNYSFCKETGYFERWGKTRKDDPSKAPFPEILDIEVTTKCDGVGGKLCPFCYKSNTPNGKNMSFETFKKILDNFPKHKQKFIKFQNKNGETPKISPFSYVSKILKNIKKHNLEMAKQVKEDTHSLCQIAFGADSKAESNPDLWKMMDYCRENGVIPNITVAEITDETADKLVEKCGAVAVSRYEDKNICYDSVKKLTDRGLKQTNIHAMISLETFDNAWETLQDRLTDPRLANLKAIVFLSLKKKGRGKGFTPLPQDKFNQIVDFAMKNNIGIGFDSCSAYKYLKSVEDHPDFKTFEKYSEPCESTAFSSYINCDGKFLPCSFSEDGEFGEGIDVVNCDDFLKDVWNHPKTKTFRKKLLATVSQNKLECRECPLFEV